MKANSRRKFVATAAVVGAGAVLRKPALAFENQNLEPLHRGLKDKLAVFGIDNEEPELAREYLQKYGYTLSTLVDRKDQAVNLYHVNEWPTTVLIDSDGKIVFYGSGFEPEKLRDALQGVGVW